MSARGPFRPVSVRQRPYPSLHAVSPGFVEAMGLRIVAGPHVQWRRAGPARGAGQPHLCEQRFLRWTGPRAPDLWRARLVGSRRHRRGRSAVRVSISRPAPRCSSSTSSRRRQALAARTSPFGLRARRWPSAPTSARSFVSSIPPQRSTTSRRWSRSCRTRCRVRACMR